MLALDALYAYVIAGVAFAIVFVTFGIQRIDPVAKGTGVLFRLAVLPGVAALWPWLLKRWIEREGKQ
jgi:hypothetical protein